MHNAGAMKSQPWRRFGRQHLRTAVALKHQGLLLRSKDLTGKEKKESGRLSCNNLPRKSKP